MKEIPGTLDLGEPGAAWVRESLKASGKSLSGLVYSSLRITAGSVLALGARGNLGSRDVDAVRRAAIVAGVEIDRKVGCQVLVKVLSDLRESHGVGVLVVESDMESPGDGPAGTLPRALTVTSSDSVLYVRSISSIRDAEDLDQFLQAAASYFLNCFDLHLMRQKLSRRHWNRRSTIELFSVLM